MFAPKTIVRGVVCGRFVVVKSEPSTVAGGAIVTVKEIGPNGQVSSRKMRFPADILVAE